MLLLVLKSKLIIKKEGDRVMRVLTLEWLKNQPACQRALPLFEQRFGQKASPKEVLIWVREINEPGWEGWLLAQDVQLTKALLENGADVHADRDLALHLAARDGKTEIVKLLLENGSNIHTWCDSPLYAAARKGQTETVELLLENGANIHAGGDYALWWAVRNGHTETAELLRQVAQQPVS